MSDFNYYADFTTEVEDTLQKIEDKITEAIEWICQKWEDTVDTWKTVISPAFAYLVHRAMKKVEEAFRILWDAFSEFVTDIWEKIDKMAGGPWELMNMSYAYTDVRLRPPARRGAPGRPDEGPDRRPLGRARQRRVQ